MMQPPAGYSEVKLVGQGATSRVFSAFEVRTGRRVALKRLHRQLLRSDASLARLRREYAVLARLRHPSIASVHDVLRWQGDPTVVMEFVTGEDLKERLQKDGPLSSATAERIARALVDVMMAVHGAGIVHRDIKPQNVRLTDDDHVFLMDFGSARFDASSELTKTGTSVGTPEYMAPELFAGSVYDPRVDIYGLGATLFEALTGRPPHRADSLTRLAFKRTQEPAPPVRRLRPDVAPGLSQLVDRCLQIRPDDRFASASLARWALDNPEVELSFQERRRHHPPCLHCKTPIPGRCAVCPACGSDHPFTYAAGSSHVVIHGVRVPDRLAEWVTTQFPERATRDHLAHLMERVAASELDSQRFASFIERDEARALADDLEGAGVQCEVIEDQGTSGWRLNLYALAAFFVAFILIGRFALGVDVGFIHAAVLVGPALAALGVERLLAVARAEQGFLSSGRYPAALLPAHRAGLGMASAGLLAAGTLAPAASIALAKIGAAGAAFVGALSMPLLVGAASMAAATGVAWWASFSTPIGSSRDSPEPGLFEKISRALSIPPLRGRPRVRASVAVALAATVFAIVPIEFAGLSAMKDALTAVVPIARTLPLPNPLPNGGVSLAPSLEVWAEPRTPEVPVGRQAGPRPLPSTAVTEAMGRTPSRRGAPGWAYGLSALFALVAAYFGVMTLGRRQRVQREARTLLRPFASALDGNRRRAISAGSRALPRRRVKDDLTAADRVATQEAPGAFLRSARTRLTDLAHCLTPEAAARLQQAIDELARRVRDRDTAERSVLARTIAETDPEQHLKLQLLALEGELEAEAARRWFAERVDSE